MNIQKTLNLIASRIELGTKLKSNPYLIEENVRSQLLVPFLQALGYDTTNPEEFWFEYPLGMSNGTKVDGAILQQEEDCLIIEVKNVNENLQRHIKQLQGYFNSTDSKCKFAILTNMKEILFFSDFDCVNKMDNDPFYRIETADVKEEDLVFLQLFLRDKLLCSPDDVYKETRLIHAYSQSEQIIEAIMGTMKAKGMTLTKEEAEKILYIRNPLSVKSMLQTEQVIKRTERKKKLPEKKRTVTKFPKTILFGKELVAQNGKEFTKEFYESLIEQKPSEMARMDQDYPLNGIRFTYEPNRFPESHAKSIIQLSNRLCVTYHLSREEMFHMATTILQTLGFKKQDLIIKEREEGGENS